MNILPDFSQCLFLSNDVVIIITLPFEIEVPILPATLGDADFETTDDGTQGTRDDVLVFVAAIL